VNELELTLGWVAKTVGGTLQSGDPALPVGDVLTDSRSLRTGDVFVALKGPRFDGHSFVEEVLERGAAGAIVEGRDAGDSRRAGPGVWTRHGAVIEVADTLRELGIDPHMTAGTIRRQQEMGDLGKREPLQSAVPQGRIAMLDAIGQALIDEKAH